MRPTPLQFWRRVLIAGPEECWPWQGACSSSGHGSLRPKGIHYIASRLAYEFAVGDPSGRLVCHHCDNPPCCNPRHLHLGDHSRNGLDAHARGLHPPINHRGEMNGNAKLATADIRKIRRRIIRGETNISIAADYPVSHGMISNIGNYILRKYTL